MDPATPEAVVAWVASFGNAKMDAAKYAEMLIAEGYEDLYSLRFTEAEVVAMEDNGGENPPRGRARKLVAAAQSVMAALGVFVPDPTAVAERRAIEDGSAAGGGASAGVGGVQVSAVGSGMFRGAVVRPGDRGDPPPFPLVSPRCGHHS